MLDTSPVPPRPAKRPVTLEHHGDQRVDEWFWLRERENPEVIEHLEAENAYVKEVMAPTVPLQERLYEEFLARIKQTDQSVPAKRGRYSYFSRTEEGKQYDIHCRLDSSAVEHLILDENALAETESYFSLGNFAISPSDDILAYATDTTGGERYALQFRDLARGADLEDRIPGTYYGLAWSADSTTVFYVIPDEKVRPYQVWRHRLGTPQTDDVLVYEESDERFFVSVGASRTRDLIAISTKSKSTTEIHVIRADDPDFVPTLVERRETGIEYRVGHHRSEEHGDRLFIVTNAGGAFNFKVVVTDLGTPGREHWRDVVPHRVDVRVEAIDVFADHIAIYERAEALERINVMRLSDGVMHLIEQPEPVYSAWGGTNLEFDTQTLRYGYTSLVTPRSVFDYDMESNERTLLKQQEVLGGYDRDEYETAREWAIAADGERVPISIVWKKGTLLDGTAPAMLYGYGSYEISTDPGFSSIRLSLLDRGVVYAMAHIRGGGEKGRLWYEQGKLFNKLNTFSDFIACAEHLIAVKYASPDRLAIRGGSAGGLLVGNVANQRPELFASVIAEVPFVDCLTTVLDESLPLSVYEWEEWGNPNEEPVYRYMKSYSPYDNVREQDYPTMFVTAGLNDPRVSYWEPAKWVARLRERKTDDNVILLKTEMEAGHGGSSGRYDSWRDEAETFAFVLTTLGVEGAVMRSPSPEE